MATTNNYGLTKPADTEFYDINIQNDNMDIIDTEIKKVEEKTESKASIFIGESLPEVEDRDSKTLYLKITDTLSSGTNENILVSPTMGIKIVE